MDRAARAVLSPIAFFSFFCMFQGLLVYWLAGAASRFLPSMIEAEELLRHDDIRGALHHLKPLANDGSLRANYLLGELYYRGSGVRRNTQAAIRHLETAAEGDLLKAQYLLSEIYSSGEAVPRDLVRAHLWLSLAALHESREAPVLLAMLEELMTAAEIERAWQLAEKRVPGVRTRILAH